MERHEFETQQLEKKYIHIRISLFQILSTAAHHHKQLEVDLWHLGKGVGYHCGILSFHRLDSNNTVKILLEWSLQTPPPWSLQKMC